MLTFEGFVLVALLLFFMMQDDEPEQTPRRLVVRSMTDFRAERALWRRSQWRTDEECAYRRYRKNGWYDT